MRGLTADLQDRFARAVADRYRVTRRLGAGGMATVLLADDLRHSRVVAVKVLNPEMTEDVGAERFLREIATSARLNHPHILPLLDSGQADEWLFYVMPWVEGETLRDRLTREGRLPLGDAIRFAAEIGDGLSYAHRAGVVHRDVKPENVLLSSGHAVVADFGIARALDQAGDARLTRTGSVTGTPFYMSPEQWDGSPDLDGRSDQYALGCVAYEMLAGAQPFTGPTAMTIMARHLQGVIPSVRDVRPEVPEHVDDAIRRALAKRPEDRFATADEFGAALRITSSVSGPASAPRVTAPLQGAPSGFNGRLTSALRTLPVRRLTWKSATALAALLGVGGYAAFRAIGGLDPPQPTRLVVLPFASQGPSDDEYFADGISDEITNRLAGVSSLAVIAWTSALQYRGSSKSSAEIGRELNVAYLIEGSVRWSPASRTTGEVRVTARLVHVTNGQTLPLYDTTATVRDVFAIQGAIAREVTEQLDVILLEPEEQRLASQPTSDLEAYDAYLRGNAAYERSWARPDVEAAVRFYEQAVKLDPEFALAWAKLARMHAWMNQLRLDLSEDRLVAAKEAADRALALEPDLAEAHLSMGLYWYWGRDDYARAIESLTRAVAFQASNAEVHRNIGHLRRRQGRFDEALASYRQAAELNPTSHSAWYNLGETYLFIRQYDEAGPHLERTTVLGPDFLEGYVQQARVAINARGDLATARRILLTAEERIPATAWRAPMLDFARIIYDPNLELYLQRMRPGAYGLDSSTYHLVKARFLFQTQGRAAAASDFDSARVHLTRMRDEQPGQAWIHGLLGNAYAGLDRAEEAVRSAQRARELLPVEKDAFDGPEWLLNLATTYVLLDNADSAAAYFDRVLAIPSWFSIHLLRVDPLYAAFARTPQYRELERKYGGRTRPLRRARGTAPPG